MIGQTISHYHILEKLGGGGMGVVYKAEDTALRRTVALKFLPSEFTLDSDAKERFVHEAQAASALEHANICSIHEIGEQNGQTFIVMGYYEGESLKERIARGALRTEEAVDIALQCARGLARAHESGIIHRDIKPANLMITTRGEVKIVDFGLAKLSGRTLVTKTGTTLGTASYMSPEQARGEQVDRRTDLWSLGVVLYEMLTGKRPFEGDYEQVALYAIVTDDPKPMKDLRPDVPDALGTIVEKLLAKRTGDRYQDASQLLTDLEAYRSGNEDTIVARPRWHRKTRKLAITISTVAIFGLALGLLFMLTGSRRGYDTVAILPLENLTGVAEQDYVADGITGELIDRLCIIKELTIRPERSVRKYKKSSLSLRDIARELDVPAIVDGSVKRVGNQISVKVELVDPSQDKVLWGKTYEKEMGQLQVLRDEIAKAILEEMRVRIAPAEQARLTEGRTGNPQAVDEYLKAIQKRRELQARPSRSLWAEGLGHINQAIALDPKEPQFRIEQAHLFYAAWSNLFMSGDSVNEPFSKAMDEAIALGADPGSVHLLRGLVADIRLEFRTALAEFQQAVDVAPGNAYARRQYSSYLASFERGDEAFKEGTRALEIDPSESNLVNFVGNVCYYTRRYDDAIQKLGEVRTKYPNNATLLNFIGVNYLLKNRNKEAIALMEESIKKSSAADRPNLMANLCFAYARSDRREEAAKMLHQLRTEMRGQFEDEFIFACLDLELGGDKEAFFRALDKAVAQRSFYVVTLRTEPTLDGIRGDPRYQALLKRVGLLD